MTYICDDKGNIGNKCSVHGSVTFRPFKKLWQTDRPSINRKTNRRTWMFLLRWPFQERSSQILCDRFSRVASHTSKDNQAILEPSKQFAQSLLFNVLSTISSPSTIITSSGCSGKNVFFSRNCSTSPPAICFNRPFRNWPNNGVFTELLFSTGCSELWKKNKHNFSSTPRVCKLCHFNLHMRAADWQSALNAANSSF